VVIPVPRQTVQHYQPARLPTVKLVQLQMSAVPAKAVIPVPRQTVQQYQPVQLPTVKLVQVQLFAVHV
jgi:hypothetical protein